MVVPDRGECVSGYGAFEDGWRMQRVLLIRIQLSQIDVRHRTELLQRSKIGSAVAGMSGTTSSKVFGTDGGAEGSGSCLGPASPGPYHGSWLGRGTGASHSRVPAGPTCPPAVRGTSCLGRRGRALLQLTLGRVQAIGDGATEQGLGAMPVGARFLAQPGTPLRPPGVPAEPRALPPARHHPGGRSRRGGSSPRPA